MRIESTHEKNSTVRVVTINGIAPDKDAVGIEEVLQVHKSDNGGRLVYKAKNIEIDAAKHSVTRQTAFIFSNSGDKIQVAGIPIIHIEDCYSVDVDGKRRYIGDGKGSFKLVDDCDGE